MTAPSAPTDRPVYTPSAPWTIVINAASGRQDSRLLQTRIRTRLERAGRAAHIHQVTSPRRLPAMAARAARQATENRGLLIAAGGDGTINLLAAKAMEHNLAFSVLPQGTFNYFGRQYGFPDDPETAITTILAGRLRPIQVGCVNEHIFLVNASFGLYPDLLVDRERFNRLWGRSRAVAILAGLYTLLRRYRLHHLHLDSETLSLDIRSPMLFVGNNELQLRELGIPEADCPGRGHLVALLPQETGKLSLIGLALHGALGALGASENLRRIPCTRLTLHPRRILAMRKVRIAVDGERRRVHPPLHIAVHARPLWLVAPRKDQLRNPV